MTLKNFDSQFKDGRSTKSMSIVLLKVYASQYVLSIAERRLKNREVYFITNP